MRKLRLSLVATLVMAVLAVAAFAGGSSGVRDPKGSARARVHCVVNVMHPITVHVTALDPIVHGAAVRLLVRASSAVALDRAEARLVSTGGTANQGPTVISLGRLDPGKVVSAQFTVGVPATGARQFVQFVVTGRGPNGNLTRGGCYNLLPDGPMEVGRLVVTPEGARVLEVRAGRID